MRRIAIAIFLSLPAICSCVEYQATGKDDRSWVVPDDFRVDPALYPKYRAIQDFQPPNLLLNAPYLKMPAISTDDIWIVRHKVGNYLWIYSEQYEARVCGGKRCNRVGQNEISIYPNGRVCCWIQIKDPKYTVLRGDRAVRVEADPRYDPDWGDGPLFSENNQ